MIPLIAPIVTMLAGKGLNLLSDTLSSATDTGIDKVKELIKEKTGINITSEDEVKSLTTEQIRQLKQIEYDHEIELKQINLENTKDARDMQKVALSQDDVFAKRFIYYFGGGIVLVTFIYIFCITFMTIPETSIRFADTILGFLLGTSLATVLNFFFGSSDGSKEKTKQIQEILRR